MGLQKNIKHALQSLPVWAGIAAFGFGVFGATVLSSKPAFSAGQCDKGRVLSVVAHEDDDLLFLSPDLTKDIGLKKCVTTLYLTAGDAGQGEAYWQSREAGVAAAYAHLANRTPVWTSDSLEFAGRKLHRMSLQSGQVVTLLFMRLPDGYGSGSGYTQTGSVSLKKLWTGEITSISALDGSGSYTKAELLKAIEGVMAWAMPDTIRTLDYEGTYTDTDHSDHHTTAYFTHEASRAYRQHHILVGYQGYQATTLPVNLRPDKLTMLKASAFFAYAQHDPLACTGPEACDSFLYAKELKRQYSLPVKLPPAPKPLLL